jgi:endonuclease-3 related protein
MKSLKRFRFPASRPLPPSRLGNVFRKLSRHFGPQDWWPGETPFEVMAGAILTQNTAWTNVEKAIANLKRHKRLRPNVMARTRVDLLARDIRPAGYFNVKAVRLKNFVRYFIAAYGGNIRRMKARPLGALRSELLAVNGIGPETADSILLYALDKPVFVIDAYTRRIFSRHRVAMNLRGPQWKSLIDRPYEEWQRLFTENLKPASVRLYNEYHALIVALGKKYCRPKNPRCFACPLRVYS